MKRVLINKSAKIDIKFEVVHSLCRFLLWFVSVGVWFPSTIMGQSGFRFSSISVEDGLNQSSVNSLEEDGFGFIWFGTQEGLAQFDGKRFKTIQAGENGSSLQADFILEIQSAGEKGVWIRTIKGVNFYSHTMRRTLSLPSSHPSYDEMNSASMLKTIGEDAYILTESGVYIIGIGEEELEVLDYLEISGISTLAVLGNELLMTDENKKVFTWSGNQQRKTDFSLEFVPKKMKVYDNTLFYWSDSLLVKQNEKSTRSFVCSANINDVLFENERGWIATEQGLEFIDEEDELQPIMTDDKPITADAIMCLRLLKDGTVAIGTQRFGAYFWHPSSLNFAHFPGRLFADPIVWDASLQETELFVCSTQGLDLFEFDQKTLSSSLLAPDKSLRFIRSWKGFHASSVYREGDSLWVGTTSSDLHLFIKTDGNWIKTQTFLLPRTMKIFSIIANEAGEKTFITNGGIFIGDPNHIKKDIYLSDYFADEQLSNYSHHGVWQGDTLWISSTTGVYTYLQESDICERVIGHSSRKPFRSINFASVYFDPQNQVIASLGDGFAHRANSLDEFEHVGKADGLLNDFIYGFVYHDHQLWGSCNEGLFKWDGESIETISELGVIPFLEHSQNAFGKLEGTPWFGGTDGFYLLRSEEQMPRVKNSPLLITEVLIDYAPVNETSRSSISGPLYGVEQVDLIDASNVSFSFASPGIQKTNESLAYRLDGSDWIQHPSLSQQLIFSSLSDGEHLLEVNTVVGENEDHQASKSIVIVVHPPFWKELWFIVLIGLGLITLVVLFVDRRNKQIIAQERLKREAIERVQKERERISMDLHDNIGAQITHVITSLDNLSFKMEQGKQANPSAEVDNLSDFARGTMQQLRDTIWSMTKEQIQVEDFADRIHDYLGRILADRQEPTFVIERVVHENHTLNAGLTVHLFRVIQEATSNALKHAEASELRLEISSGNEQLKVVFKDNGKGFSNQLAHSEQYGIRNMKARMKQVNGQFKMVSKSNVGTEITLQVPLR